MKIIVNILLYIWQLPQNLIGFFLTRKPNHIVEFECNDGSVTKVYFTENVFGCGVSLGNYIILDVGYYYISNNITITVNHEHGHQKQSKMLGWLYLIIVGITSAIFNNLWDRLFHKNWGYDERERWYYSRNVEKWADELGGVKRFTD
jgi:hypothetical protein